MMLAACSGRSSMRRRVTVQCNADAEMLVSVYTSRLSCRKAEKAPIFTPVQGHLENPSGWILLVDRLLVSLSPGLV